MIFRWPSEPSGGPTRARAGFIAAPYSSEPGRPFCSSEGISNGHLLPDGRDRSRGIHDDAHGDLRDRDYVHGAATPEALSYSHAPS